MSTPAGRASSRSPRSAPAIACIAEDRESETIAVKLLVLSLSRHCPELRIVLTFPAADESFKNWARRFQQLELRTEAIGGAKGWNVKPHILLPLLEDGAAEVWWLDSDVMVTGDFRLRTPDASSEAIVVCQEALYGSPDDYGARARAWGLEPRRILPSTVNTCAMRMTPQHSQLLSRWHSLLEDDVYVRAQAQPWHDRPAHLLGDQDVLTALLSSPEFADIPISWLRRGRDIIQYFGPPGYTTRDRISNLRHGFPPLVHEQGGHKPWHARPGTESGIRSFVDDLYVELSPYRFSAQAYRGDLAPELDEFDWLDYSSTLGSALEAMSFGKAPLLGFPVALAYSAFSQVRKLRRHPRRARDSFA